MGARFQLSEHRLPKYEQMKGNKREVSIFFCKPNAPFQEVSGLFYGIHFVSSYPICVLIQKGAKNKEGTQVLT